MDHNGAQAAIRAGYSENGARTEAARLLKLPEVIERVEELERETAESLKITREKVLLRLADIAFFDPRKMYRDDGRLLPIHKMDADVAAGVAGFEEEEIFEEAGTLKKVKLRDTKSALDSIAKMLGFNAPEKVDHTSKGESLVNAGIEKLTNKEKLELFRLRQKMADAVPVSGAKPENDADE